MEHTRVALPYSQRVAAKAARMEIAIVGGSLRAASILRLLLDVEDIAVVAVCDENKAAPAMRLADEIGVFATEDISELAQFSALDIVINMTEDDRIKGMLSARSGSKTEFIGPGGSELIWDLLVAKKRGEEQEKLFVELQVAYDKIRGHERRLQSGKEALEKANEELEGRLAEIFFTHEFFKALTNFSSVADVSSLIVDGCNGILGAEISCVYLFEQESWTLRLRASQGRPEEDFKWVVPVSETILGEAFREGVQEERDVQAGAPSLSWMRAPDGIRSQAALPLRSGDSVVGVLAVASSQRRELSGAEMDRLQVIAHQSSLALQNALLHEELERLSVTDRLTELYNHGYFQQRLDEEIDRAARFGRDLSLIMLDIDDFKEFNDSFGHPRGDTVLKAVSAMIRQSLREIDVAARYGGEEFCIVLPETDTVGAMAVAERIRDAISRHSFVEGAAGVHKTVSVGVATYPRHASAPGKLIEAADKAMYRAKRDGKNRVALAE